MAESARLPQPGEILAAKYRIERTIGSGGMSVVYGATHQVTGKRFAIKWLVPERASSSAEATQRFMAEARVAGRFQHPNVVQIYDFGESAGSFYMVMEWLEGETLAARLARVGRLSLHEACDALIPCMWAMSKAHDVGIVHRDLKPANIFLCDASEHRPECAKVLDFGISKVTGGGGFDEVSSVLTKTGMLIGTPHYLSPEQLRAKPVDQRSDIYAFGVILYQVLSGELPFPADNLGELALEIASGTPIPLRQSLPELAPEVETVVAQAMARDPAARFQHLPDLVFALQALSRQQAMADATSDTVPLNSLRAVVKPKPAGKASRALSAMQSLGRRPSLRIAAYVVALLAIVAVGFVLARSYADHADAVGARAAPPKNERLVMPAPTRDVNTAAAAVTTETTVSSAPEAALNEPVASGVSAETASLQPIVPQPVEPVPAAPKPLTPPPAPPSAASPPAATPTAQPAAAAPVAQAPTASTPAPAANAPVAVAQPVAGAAPTSSTDPAARPKPPAAVAPPPAAPRPQPRPSSDDPDDKNNPLHNMEIQ